MSTGEQQSKLQGEEKITPELVIKTASHLKQT